MKLTDGNKWKEQKLRAELKSVGGKQVILENQVAA